MPEINRFYHPPKASLAKALRMLGVYAALKHRSFTVMRIPVSRLPSFDFIVLITVRAAMKKDTAGSRL
jgi:hypothetical protein